MDNEIKDFGEKIGGAKKDLWKSRGLQVNDLEEMNLAEKDKYIIKNNIWNIPDYKALVDEGLPIRVAYFVKLIRDSAPTKPVITYKDNTPEAVKEKQEGYITFMNNLRDKTMALKTEPEVLNFYENVIKQYTISSGGYRVVIKEEAYDCINNKLLKAAQLSSFRSIDNDIMKKQFCYSDEDKILSNYTIALYSKDNISFEKDYSNRTMMSIKVPNGKVFIYPKGEFENPDSWINNTYFIIKNNSIHNYNFTSKEEAKQFILDTDKSKSVEKSSTTTRKKSFIPTQLDSLKYIGPDYKKNKDITGEDYLKVFNFKGGEFGNWLNQEDRQSNLNHAYNAFNVLADALKIKTTDISLNNNLSIAFGSRGNSSAMAHYEPLREVINLTKMKGAGSLAHEWGHALDDILNKSVTGQSLDKRRIRDLLEEHKELIDKIKYKTDISSEKSTKVIETDFYKNSRVFDTLFAKEKEGYWSSDVEMFARAFACYVKDKASELGLRCDYLTGHSDSAITIHNDKTIRAFPIDEERKVINKCFDELISKYKELNLLHNKDIGVPKKTLNDIIKNASESVNDLGKESTLNRDKEDR